MLAPWKKSYDQPSQRIKKQRHFFANKSSSNQSYGFSSSHVWCESWTIKKAKGWRIDAFELWSWRKFLRVPWTAWRSNQSILKEISPEYSLEGLMLKAEAPLFRPPDAKNWLIGKYPDAGQHWRQEKWTLEDEMVGWHHRLDGHQFAWTSGVGDGEGVLAVHGVTESDMTERLNWTELVSLMEMKRIHGHY